MDALTMNLLSKINLKRNMSEQLSFFLSVFDLFESYTCTQHVFTLYFAKSLSFSLFKPTGQEFVIIIWHVWCYLNLKGMRNEEWGCKTISVKENRNLVIFWYNRCEFLRDWLSAFIFWV